MNGTTSFDIVAILWEDHYTTIARPIPENPDDLINTPTLTVGILLKETDKTYLIAHDIEKYEFTESCATMSVILKGTVVGIQKYGNIQLEGVM